MKILYLKTANELKSKVHLDVDGNNQVDVDADQDYLYVYWQHRLAEILEYSILNHHFPKIKVYL